MLFDFVIWKEIISHLKNPEDKSTLCSLAATSRSISNLALDSLWQSGGTIWAIVSVINSFAPSANELFLEYTEDDEESDHDDEDSTSSLRMIIGWVLNKPIPPAVCERALGYLARIRSFAVCHNGSPEGLLWPILSASFDSHGPLLPNLERLDIDFYIYDRNEYLIPLLSPSLKTLLISCERPPKLNAIFTFLNLAKSQCCELEHFKYYGDLTPHIPGVITLFSNLQSVCLPHNQVLQFNTSTTIIQFLRSLPFLRSLTCPTGIFSPSIDEEPFRHNILKEIMITVSEPATLRDLFRVCTFPSVTTVRIRSGELLSMDGIESSCPNTRKLNLSVNAVDPPLEFGHLSSLLSLPIQSFILQVQEHTLTAPDLRSFAEAWPNMRYLRITSETQIDPLQSLIAFLNHPRLHYLNMPLSFFQLLNDILDEGNLRATGVSPQNGGRHPLRTLFLKYGGAGPCPPRLSTKKKRVVVGHLLRLFPNLEEILFSIDPDEVSSIEDDLSKFQEILVKLKEERDSSLNLS